MSNYYDPIKSAFDDFLERNDHSALAKKVVGEYQTEIDVYMNYKDYFSYGFYIARKN